MVYPKTNSVPIHKVLIQSLKQCDLLLFFRVKEK